MPGVTSMTRQTTMPDQFAREECGLGSNRWRQLRYEPNLPTEAYGRYFNWTRLLIGAAMFSCTIRKMMSFTEPGNIGPGQTSTFTSGRKSIPSIDLILLSLSIYPFPNQVSPR